MIDGGVIDEARLQDYFAGRMGSGITVRRVKRTFPGISRETFLVWTEEGGQEGGYVFRTDAPGGPMPLAYEYRVMKTLHGTTVPVAEPLWFDEAPEVSGGRPVMVRRMVDGSNDIPGLFDAGEDVAARRRRIAFDHAEKLAALHTLDLDAHGFTDFMEVRASPALAARYDFDRWV
jgi:aminoglycoside phosphotransferase (APT) family kinase protein